MVVGNSGASVRAPHMAKKPPLWNPSDARPALPQDRDGVAGSSVSGSPAHIVGAARTPYKVPFHIIAGAARHISPTRIGVRAAQIDGQ
jgi:hypothetical protein